MKTEFRLTGKVVFGVLAGFFLVVLAANAVLINLAVKSFPGEIEAKSYLQGLHFNDRIAAREEQAKLGWTAAITEAARVDGEASIELEVRDLGGRSVSGLTIDGVLSRPAMDAEDAPLRFAPVGAGVYRARVRAGAGAWNMAGLATDAAGRRFEFATRLVLE